jgi:hypothetical protein
MIKLENVTVYGWEAAIRGMRNPMNSWDKSDSFKQIVVDEVEVVPGEWETVYENSGVGPNDLDLMKRLIKAGPDHSKFMRMIGVFVDIVAPLYWWKEFDTYKVGTVANSCSTMHKIHSKEFTLDDFSHEHLLTECDAELGYYVPLLFLKATIKCLNENRKKFIETKDKKYWWNMIQLLPSSYNQRRTVSLNYAVLANMYHARKEHKLDEWRELCEWVKGLPYSELITRGWEE